MLLSSLVNSARAANRYKEARRFCFARGKRPIYRELPGKGGAGSRRGFPPPPGVCSVLLMTTCSSGTS